jgi:hypothetical protein
MGRTSLHGRTWESPACRPHRGRPRLHIWVRNVVPEAFRSPARFRRRWLRRTIRGASRRHRVPGSMRARRPFGPRCRRTPDGVRRPDLVIPPRSGSGGRPRRLPAARRRCQRFADAEPAARHPPGSGPSPRYTRDVSRVPRCVAGVVARFLGNPRREGGEKPPRTRRRDRPVEERPSTTRTRHATDRVGPLPRGPGPVGKAGPRRGLESEDLPGSNAACGTPSGRRDSDLGRPGCSAEPLPRHDPRSRCTHAPAASC